LLHYLSSKTFYFQSYKFKFEIKINCTSRVLAKEKS
jgi:hypothetical protein